MSNVASAGPALLVEIAGRRWRVGTRAHDLSIPLQFDAPQPSFFGVPAAHAQAVSAGSFVGDVRRGGSCNCSTHTLTPHCNGTHTECIGHITAERISVRDVAHEHLIAAALVSVHPTPAAQTPEKSDPAPQPADRLITRQSLQSAAANLPVRHCRALVVRTLPNAADKRQRNYDVGDTPAYFSSAAMRWIVSCGIEHLIVDLPSLDRANDDGRLTTHRIFWGLAATLTDGSTATRRGATVTELAYVDDGVADGMYLLNLQVAPFVADAAPSRPILFTLEAA